MRILLALTLVLFAGRLAAARPEEAGGQAATAYTPEEIERYLGTFNATYKDRKQPEEDAISVLADLHKAYHFLDTLEKEGKSTPDTEKLKKRIVTDVIKGLKARERPLVTLECVKTLGDMGDRRASKDLLSWLDKPVLDSKSPNPQWVEEGFKALAYTGEDDDATIKFVIGYATGKHVDETVPGLVLGAIPEWRHLDGKVRKELFERVLGYVGGLHSMQNKGGAEGAKAKERYERVKENGMRALTLLSGSETPLKDPVGAREWFSEHKKGFWEDYVGPKFRAKPEEKKPEESKPEEKKPEEKKPGEGTPPAGAAGPKKETGG